MTSKSVGEADYVCTNNFADKALDDVEEEEDFADNAHDNVEEEKSMFGWRSVKAADLDSFRPVELS